MNILYCRVSTIDQNTDRQRINEKDFREIEIIEDRCSGAIPIFEREGGKHIQMLTENGAVKQLTVWTIDRLGRDMRDIVNTIHYLTARQIQFISGHRAWLT